MPSDARGPETASPSKRDRRKLRRLERRLTEARAEEARRSDRLERARRDGGARRIERRARKLERARARSEGLAAKIAELRPVAPTAKAPTANALLAYCLRDRERVEIQDPQPMTMRNGRPAVAGRCPRCGGRLVRAVPRQEAVAAG